ncbi:WRKY domain-containing protein [Cephalotus follicularis]|uniref:WRKY domain-containing protein n=1 Tax=Cephalotus follicularis TaxID=3775 RepID=A0A1Q3C7T0_CEPFO|nr:WRKY domain-containing protein [Cephalotus follicularis]
MSEFVYMEGWDLQAVVRGCSTNDAAANMLDNNPSSFFAPLSLEQDHDFLLSFPEFCGSNTTSVFDELEDLYKPFYPMLQPHSPQTSLASSFSVANEEQEQKKQQPPVESDISATRNDIVTNAVKSKRRKNQNKMVVEQVTAEGLLSDKWAWRKYGQKPIKGSPYPRSYYRCSSSKGCLARKQVERDPTDPRFFIVTYTAEHSHTHPTRRNCLAGSTRNKSSTPKVSPHMTIPADTVASPTTPSMASTEDENVKKDEEQMLEDDQSNTSVMQDMMFSDDMYPSFEDMERLFINQY